MPPGSRKMPTTFAPRKPCAFRFSIWNSNEGLEQSYATGLDEDRFDTVCDHLIVEHLPSANIVGTYRLQTGHNAAQNLGYYCALEFDFETFEPLRAEMIELGRACVHPQHRNLVVLGQSLERHCGLRSATRRSVSFWVQFTHVARPGGGASAYADLCRKHLAPPEWRTQPIPVYECPMFELTAEPVKIPKFLRAYLTLGAKICGPPALDRNFKTIDFLTLLDLEAMPALARQKFLGA